MAIKLLRYALACSALVSSFASGQVLSGLPGGNPGQGGGAPTVSAPVSNNGPGSFGAFTKGNMSDIDEDIRNNDRSNRSGDSTTASTRIGYARSSLPSKTQHMLNDMFPGTHAVAKVNSGPLAGLTTGVALMSNGIDSGTVQQIRMAEDGSVAVVIVQGSNGGFYGVPVDRLTMTGGVLSTRMRLAGATTAAGAPPR
jgi:hypothetical protein